VAQASGDPALPFFRIWPEASWLGKGSYVVEAKPAAVLDFIKFVPGRRRLFNTRTQSLLSQAVKRTPAVAVLAALGSEVAGLRAIVVHERRLRAQCER